MKEIPILFSTPMAQAILEGRKSQTRRLVKDKHVLYSLDVNKMIPEYFKDGDGGWCPYGKPRDLLWVRETWRGIEQDYGSPRYEYKATETINVSDKWKPSIHMPKAIARIWLQVTDIRVERLQDISEEDAIAEGITATDDPFKFMNPLLPDTYFAHAQNAFFSLWESINGNESLQANPWLWVVSFNILSTTGKPTLCPKS